MLNSPSETTIVMKRITAIAALLVLGFSLPKLVAADPAPLSVEAAAGFPYSMVGQLVFTSGDGDYQGSGTLIHRRSVLTAGHNLWDEFSGWSTDVEFNRGRHGDEMLSQDIATRLFLFSGYRTTVFKFGSTSEQAFANDLGGLRFAADVAGGTFVGWKAKTSLLLEDANCIAVGYGAVTHSGDEPLFVEPTGGFEIVRGGFFENYGITFEGGMSGGPVLVEAAPGDWRVMGVIVAGTEKPNPSGGIRALNSAAATFISTYLRR